MSYQAARNFDVGTYLDGTGEADELIIDSVRVPNGTGYIGFSACPGCQRSPFSGQEMNRDLDRDLEAIGQWGAMGVVTLIEAHEMEAFGVLTLPERTELYDMWWLHLPISDMCAPNGDFEARWADESPNLHRILSVGGRVLLHCWAGLGRTGMVAARILIERGVAPRDAIKRVRAARPGAIQTNQQEDYLLRLRQIHLA